MMTMKSLTIVLIACAAIGCARDSEDPRTSKRIQELESKVAALSVTQTKPDLGETMHHVHIRHQRLAVAIDEGSWDLAEYLLDEIGDALADAGAAHPKARKLDDVPQSVRMFLKAPTERLDAAIKQKDAVASAAALDELSAGCNGCHAAAGIGFNVIRRPASTSARSAGLMR
jgi:cytochrome c556